MAPSRSHRPGPAAKRARRRERTGRANDHAAHGIPSHSRRTVELTFDRHRRLRENARAGTRASTSARRGSPRWPVAWGPGDIARRRTDRRSPDRTTPRARASPRAAPSLVVVFEERREQRAHLVVADRIVLGPDEFVFAGGEPVRPLRSGDERNPQRGVARREHEVHAPRRHHHAEPVRPATARSPLPRPAAPD